MPTPSQASLPNETPSLPQTTPPPTGAGQSPFVLSYVALRKAVGFIALLLPVVLYIGANLGHSWRWKTSISAYYYTDMRNLFVGSLCALAMFQMACKGYKNRAGHLDEIGSWLSGIFALGVAFSPTVPGPDDGVAVNPLRIILGHIHIACAVLLFLTLAGFCLYLFKLTTSTSPTAKKIQRNRVYTLCGWGILASMAFIPLAKSGLHFDHAMFVGETAALIFFGVAWLVKGQAFLTDRVPDFSPATEAHIP